MMRDATADREGQALAEVPLDIVPEKGAKSGLGVRFNQIKVQKMVQKVRPGSS